jgi:hypothetical protein
MVGQLARPAGRTIAVVAALDALANRNGAVGERSRVAIQVGAAAGAREGRVEVAIEDDRRVAGRRKDRPRHESNEAERPHGAAFWIASASPRANPVG